MSWSLFLSLVARSGTNIVRENASKIREGRFNLVWLPPSSYSGEGPSAGYNPKQYFNPYRSYGSSAQHLALLHVLLANGMEPVADIVSSTIADGTGGWARFENPDWGLWAVCRSDEAFTRQDSDVRGSPENLREGSVPTGSLENHNCCRDLRGPPPDSGCAMLAPTLIMIAPQFGAGSLGISSTRGCCFFSSRSISRQRRRTISRSFKKYQLDNLPMGRIDFSDEADAARKDRMVRRNV